MKKALVFLAALWIGTANAQTTYSIKNLFNTDVMEKLAKEPKLSVLEDILQANKIINKSFTEDELYDNAASFDITENGIKYEIVISEGTFSLETKDKACYDLLAKKYKDKMEKHGIGHDIIVNEVKYFIMYNEELKKYRITFEAVKKP